jgi:hypothetical protein
MFHPEKIMFVVSSPSLCAIDRGSMCADPRVSVSDESRTRDEATRSACGIAASVRQNLQALAIRLLLSPEPA